VAQIKEEAMGAAENVATMQRAYDAFNVADLDTLTEIFDENIVWHLPGKSSMATDYQGRDAVLAYFGQLGQETDGTFRAELERLMADDDGRVVGFQRSTADRNGSHLDVGNCIVFTLEDGRVTDGREHFEDLYAWDQFWS
jgi:ketosteroid isomerase-like protein